MSTTTTRTPLDEQARAARRERVRALTESVSQHLASGTLATDTRAGLDLKALVWEVGGMSRYIQAQTTTLLGEDDGNHLCCGWFAGTLGAADEARALAAFERAGVSRLAGRARGLNQLCVEGQQALDTVSMSESSAEDHTNDELFGAVAEVEDRADRRSGRTAVRRPLQVGARRESRRSALAVIG